MRVDLFDFDLPESCIAQHPVHPRDSARLLAVGDKLLDVTIRDLPSFLQEGDILVFNDTKVIPARLKGRRGEAHVEVTLHKHISPSDWNAFAKPGKRLRPGDTIIFAPDFTAEVRAKNEDGEVTLCFDVQGPAMFEKLQRYGQMPLPPYIKRKQGADPNDTSDYQTIFAKEQGAVAAPTAGLHFTETLLAALRRKNIQAAQVTLHVGAGTFLPVRVDDTDNHVMHSEFARVTAETVAKINTARQAGGRVVAVGTTSLRVLESAAKSGVLTPFEGETDIFITPGYRFHAVDILMTNFHLPRSTLFMLVSAFAGLQRMKSAYAHAIAFGYRFYSYGDACLLYKAR